MKRCIKAPGINAFSGEGEVGKLEDVPGKQGCLPFDPSPAVGGWMKDDNCKVEAPPEGCTLEVPETILCPNGKNIPAGKYKVGKLPDDKILHRYHDHVLPLTDEKGVTRHYCIESSGRHVDWS
ncbi:MAG: hypothetical protein WA057_00200, partial [Candidatus Magasanikiibacteriota bacterium]